MPPKKNAIPDRWTDYQALGKRIPGTRFIAFKVPLKQSLRSRLPPAEVFGPFDLKHLLEQERQELGLIIDLTFTTRYYKPEDLPDTMNYLKIFTAGHEVPSDSTILSFKRAVSRFLRDNDNNDKLIGVHCTHGLNRTGYLVCRYLIDVDGMEPREAIDLFNASRGHAIERENYLDDLTLGPKRSNEGMEQAEQEPVPGCAGQRRRDAPSHRGDPYSRHTSFNGQRPHQELPHHSHYGPLHQRGLNNHGAYHGGPGLMPPPPGLWPPRRPPYHELDWRRPRYPPPLPRYPPPPPRYPPPPLHPDQLPRYTFGEPRQEPNGHGPPPPPSTPGFHQEPQGPRRSRHRAQRPRKDWT